MHPLANYHSCWARSRSPGCARLVSRSGAILVLGKLRRRLEMVLRVAATRHLADVPQVLQLPYLAEVGEA